jgi:hydrogenase nickel incorporation protein HypA/HybF
MHELSIALRLAELVEEQLAGEPPTTVVTAVHIRIGDLSSVVPEALQFAWEPATQGTRLHGANLCITRPQGSDALELAAVELSDLPC